MPLVTVLVALPLAGLLAIAFVDRRHDTLIRTMAASARQRALAAYARTDQD